MTSPGINQLRLAQSAPSPGVKRRVWCKSPGVFSPGTVTIVPDNCAGSILRTSRRMTSIPLSSSP